MAGIADTDKTTVDPGTATTPLAQADARRAELADFLRTRRGRVSPESVGLEANGRRRTPGLRREEVAQLSGVGVSWYTWLEQGRDIRPSPQVLDALARVLRLEVAERAHLFHLARVELPLAAGDYPREAPPALAAFVEGLMPHPALLMGPRTDVLAWNRAAAAVIHDFADDPPERRNMLWLLFTRMPGSAQQADTAKRTLARFRAEHARRVGDPAFDALIAELSQASADFRAWWPRHEVLTEQSGTKTVPHPTLGELRLHHLQSTPTSNPDLRLTLYVPGDDATRAAIAGALA